MTDSVVVHDPLLAPVGEFDWGPCRRIPVPRWVLVLLFEILAIAGVAWAAMAL